MSDIRKWFIKQHKPEVKVTETPPASTNPPPTTKNPLPENSNSAQEGQEMSGRRKTSKYFAGGAQKPKDEKETQTTPVKRKLQKSSDEMQIDVKPPSATKVRKVEEDDDYEATPTKRLKKATGRGIAKKPVDIEDDDDEGADAPVRSGGRGRGSTTAAGSGRGRGITKKPVDIDDNDDEVADTPAKIGGRGRGSTTAAASGRGRGGRGGFMPFGERQDPPHKGEKEVPEGAPNCLAGITFVITGTLDSLEREEAEDLIKRHGGRVTSAVSSKTTYLLLDEDIGGSKSTKAKALGTKFISEDGLFDLIRKSQPQKAPLPKESPKKTVDKVAPSQPKPSPSKIEAKDVSQSKKIASTPSPAKRRQETTNRGSLTWTEKYKPKVPNEIIGNQTIVKQLHEWLANWDDNHLNLKTSAEAQARKGSNGKTETHTGSKGKRKSPSDSKSPKAVLLSGTPGIGKSTSAKLVCQMLGFQAIEVNASDSRGKADSKIIKGIGGSTANSVKELVGSGSLNVNMDRSKHPKSVLIMDEVDGMSAGDRGGVADLIASIKMSKIPIICICNDRYSQKLKSLVNHCLLLNYRKPTKQQMAKRLLQVANAEGLKVTENVLEELGERVNGDMRMAINQLQYMSLSMTDIKYDDMKKRLLASAKDEDISPFTAVDKLMGYNGGKLRMDERMDLSMSDMDLVPLLIQENYLNYKPSAAFKDENDVKRLDSIARAAESIANGDIINVQIRRYRQWQLSQCGSLSSCIIPAYLMHGQRQVLEQGERNFNRFGGWLGKNSTFGKNSRLLEDVHSHLLSSREIISNRESLRVDYLSLFLKQLTDPLRQLEKDQAVEKVVEFMDTYSINQEDFDTIVELSTFKGHRSPLEGILPAVKGALTKGYKIGSSLRVVRAADMITVPGVKKAPKKRIAAILEPNEEEIGGEAAIAESEEENGGSDDEDMGNGGKKLKLDLQTSSSKGIQVQVELKNNGSSSSGKKAPASRAKKGTASAEKKGAGRGRKK